MIANYFMALAANGSIEAEALSKLTPRDRKLYKISLELYTDNRYHLSTLTNYSTHEPIHSYKRSSF